MSEPEENQTTPRGPKLQRLGKWMRRRLGLLVTVVTLLAAISTILYNLPTILNNFGWRPENGVDGSQSGRPDSVLYKRTFDEKSEPEPIPTDTIQGLPQNSLVDSHLFASDSNPPSFLGKKGQVVAATVRERFSETLLEVSVYPATPEADPLNNLLVDETGKSPGLFLLPLDGRYFLRLERLDDPTRELEVRVYRALDELDTVILKDTLLKGQLERPGEIDLFRVPVDQGDRLLFDTNVASTDREGRVGVMLFDDVGILASSTLNSFNQLEVMSFSKGELTLAVYGPKQFDALRYEIRILGLERPASVSKGESVVSTIDFPGDSKLFLFRSEADDNWKVELKCLDELWADLLIVDPRGSVLPKVSCKRRDIARFDPNPKFNGMYRIKVIGVQGSKGNFTLVIQ